MSSLMMSTVLRRDGEASLILPTVFRTHDIEESVTAMQLEIEARDKTLALLEQVCSSRTATTTTYESNADGPRALFAEPWR